MQKPITFWKASLYNVCTDEESHWRPVRKRINYKMATPVCSSLSGIATYYLALEFGLWACLWCRHGHGLGWPMGCVGLGWVQNFLFKMGWVEFGQIWFNAMQTTLVNCNHEYFLIPVTFILRKFSVIYELSVPFFLAELLTVFRNNCRVMIKTPMNPISSTTQMAPWSDIASGRRISTVVWGCQAHPLHLSQLCPVWERHFSGQLYHDWRSFKAVAEYCWSNGTHSLGSAWFSGSLLNMDNLTIWFSLTWHLLLAVLAIFYVATLQLWLGGARGLPEYFSSMGGVGWVTKTGPMAMSALMSVVVSCALLTQGPRSSGGPTVNLETGVAVIIEVDR